MSSTWGTICRKPHHRVDQRAPGLLSRARIRLTDQTAALARGKEVVERKRQPDEPGLATSLVNGRVLVAQLHVVCGSPVRATTRAIYANCLLREAARLRGRNLGSTELTLRGHAKTCS